VHVKLHRVVGRLTTFSLGLGVPMAKRLSDRCLMSKCLISRLQTTEIAYGCSSLDDSLRRTTNVPSCLYIKQTRQW